MKFVDSDVTLKSFQASKIAASEAGIDILDKSSEEALTILQDLMQQGVLFEGKNLAGIEYSLYQDERTQIVVLPEQRVVLKQHEDNQRLIDYIIDDKSLNIDFNNAADIALLEEIRRAKLSVENDFEEKGQTQMVETKHEVLDFFDSYLGSEQYEENWSSRFSEKEIHMLYGLAVSEFIEDLGKIYNPGNDLSDVARLDNEFDSVSDIARSLEYVKKDITNDEHEAWGTIGSVFWDAPYKYGSELAPEDVVRNMLALPIVQQFATNRDYSDFEIFKDKFVGIGNDKQYSWEQKIQQTIGKETKMTLRDFVENYVGYIEVKNNKIGHSIPFEGNGNFRFSSNGLERFKDVLNFEVKVKDVEAIIQIPENNDKLKEFSNIEQAGLIFTTLAGYEFEKDYSKWFNTQQKIQQSGKEEKAVIEEDVASGYKKVQTTKLKVEERKMTEQYDDVSFDPSVWDNPVGTATGTAANQKEAGKMAIQEKEAQAPYVRKTRTIIDRNALIDKGQSKYGANIKGFIKEAVAQYDMKDINGNTFYRTQLTISKKEPVNGVYPESNYYTFVQYDSKTPVDFSEYENAQKPIAFKGQKCRITKRDKDGRGIGEKTDRFFAIAPFEVEKSADGKLQTVLVAQRNRNGLGEDVFVPKFISPIENSVDNIRDLAGREHVRGHYVNAPGDAFNIPVLNHDGSVKEYSHRLSMIYTPIKEGKPVTENGKLKSEFMRLTGASNEPFTEEQINDIKTTGQLSVNYVEHIYDVKDKATGQYRSGIHACEFIAVDAYLKRDKSVERDPRANASYVGVVEDITSVGFNTHAENSSLIVAHEWADISPDDAGKIAEGAVVEIKYDSERKISSIEQKAPEKERESGQEME